MQDKKWLPSDFMRARRPELFSDSSVEQERKFGKSQLEFYLATLTQRKEEYQFENFCRRLAEKEICPNLIPQTGPTGGGDSKVDSETHPVASSIAERWFIGEPDKSSSERWAFAMSAKENWREKFKSDVKKAIDTQRGYSRIFFMTNQSVKDKDRATLEDLLSTDHLQVKIFDRTWIVDKIHQSKRWEIVAETLDVEPIEVAEKKTVGPKDTERSQRLEKLDLAIQDSARYQTAKYQLAEDCLEAALLARSLGSSRSDVDGRFLQAERLARKYGTPRQLARILYKRAWTANFWFDDFEELDRLYSEIEKETLQTDSVWDLDRLCNLRQAALTWKNSKPYDELRWSQRTTSLVNALKKHASDKTKATSALWAQTQIIFIDLIAAIGSDGQLNDIFERLKVVLLETEGLVDYPLESVITIIQELGENISTEDSYEAINELIIGLKGCRSSKTEKGLMRLKTGFQYLVKGMHYSAIDNLAKAQVLLAKEEQKDNFIEALVGTALGYEAAGLLWAARANLVVALSNSLGEYHISGTLEVSSVLIIRKLIWIELQLGRIPCVLQWLELCRIITKALEFSAETKKQMEDEYRLVDSVFGLLILRTQFADAICLCYLAEIVQRLELPLSRGATLFALGHEAQFVKEAEFKDDLQAYFSHWHSQPAGRDLPADAQWNTGTFVTISTMLLGCQLEIVTANNSDNIIIAETLLAFLESFFSTAIKIPGCIAMKPKLKIELAKSIYADQPFSHTIKEDECGETTITIEYKDQSRPVLMSRDNSPDALFELVARIISELHLYSESLLEILFDKHRAPDRAFLAAQSTAALINVLDKPKYYIEDWLEKSLTEAWKMQRTERWLPSPTPGATICEVQRNESLMGIDGLRHRDLALLSIINMSLWNKAGWNGVLTLIYSTEDTPPELILLFRKPEVAEKIFRGWERLLGREDQYDSIVLTQILGTDKANRPYYRLVIGPNSGTTLKQESSRLEVGVFRMQDMFPQDSRTMDTFKKAFEKHGKYVLRFGWLANAESTPKLATDFGIIKTQFHTRHAWQIDLNEPLSAATFGIEQPFIPDDVENAPILQVLKRNAKSS